MNYVRNVERGLRVPRPDALDTLCRALEVNDATRLIWRRLAGIDPDPGATPEAKAARRDAWPVLAYALVNDILLPRLELVDAIARRGPAADVFGEAAGASDAHSFAVLREKAARPPAAVRRAIERSFAQIPADTIRTWAERLDWVDLREGHSDGGVFPLRHIEYRVEVLAPMRTPGHTVHELHDYVTDWGFDRSFAVAYFPYIYWHACRCWPFTKVVIPLARRDSATQRHLYEAVRAGLSPAELDEALLGEGEIGTKLTQTSPARPLLDADPDSPENVVLDVEGGPTREQTYTYFGPPVPHDRVFDHIDRSSFLDQFPLLKIDREHFLSLIARLELPSWQRWKECLAAGCREIPDGAAPFGKAKAEDVISGDRIQTHRVAGLTAEMLASEFRAAAECCVLAGDWTELARAGEAIGIARSWQRVLRDWASASLRTDEDQ